MTEMKEQMTEDEFFEFCDAAGAEGQRVREFVRNSRADALDGAANYFASGLHCADMRATPEETVRDLRRRAQRMRSNDE